MGAISIAAAMTQKADREHFVSMSRSVVKKKLQKEQTPRRDPKASALAQLCLALHRLAQKYVPRTPTAFQDFDALTQATKALQKLGLNPDLCADICAPAKAVENAVILNSPEYRRLQNRFIAALATIADMTEKNSPPGHPEYQRGVREGYRRASDIAILFLEDLRPGNA